MYTETKRFFHRIFHRGIHGARAAVYSDGRARKKKKPDVPQLPADGSRGSSRRVGGITRERSRADVSPPPVPVYIYKIK